MMSTTLPLSMDSWNGLPSMVLPSMAGNETPALATGAQAGDTLCAQPDERPVAKKKNPAAAVNARNERGGTEFRRNGGNQLRMKRLVLLEVSADCRRRFGSEDAMRARMRSMQACFLKQSARLDCGHVKF